VILHLAAKWLDAASRHSASFDGDIVDHPLPTVDVAHHARSFGANYRDAVARLSAATEHNAAEFIRYKLPKQNELNAI
jgi:hypothetical protein